MALAPAGTETEPNFPHRVNLATGDDDSLIAGHRPTGAVDYQYVV